MSDRTNGAITFYSVPIEQVGVVLKLVEEFIGSNDWSDHDAPPGVLQLGGTFGAHQVNCGNSDAITSALIAQAPGAAFHVFEDPFAEWLGSLNCYTPELGHFTATCDSDGTPMFSPIEVLGIMNLALVADQDRALGR